MAALQRGSREVSFLNEEPLEPMFDPAQRFMRLAIEEARGALRENEVPVGAIIVHQGRVIAAAHNQRETLRDPTAHAEMLAITQAAADRNDWRLEECELYVTLEPCPMCAARSSKPEYLGFFTAPSDPKAGAVDSLFQLLADRRLNHQVETRGGILAAECGAMLTEFFREQRRLGKK